MSLETGSSLDRARSSLMKLSTGCSSGLMADPAELLHRAHIQYQVNQVTSGVQALSMMGYVKEATGAPR